MEERPAPVGTEKRFVDPSLADRRAQRQEPAGKSLRETHHVRYYSGQTTREHSPRAPKARQDFVSD